MYRKCFVVENILNLKQQTLNSFDMKFCYLEIITEIKQQKLKHCLIDFSEIKYMNSTLITLVYKIVTYFNENGIKYSFINHNNHIKNIFKATNLNLIFKFDEANTQSNKQYTLNVSN